MKRTMPGIFEAAVAVVIAAAAAVMFRSVDPAISNSGDAYTNLVSAYNLAYHGVISQSRDVGSLPPGNYREPLPIVALAAYIKLTPSLASGHTPASLNTGTALVKIKYLNILCAVLCLVGIAIFVRLLLRDRPAAVRAAAAALAVILTCAFYFAGSGWLVVNEITTELPASTLLVWASAAQFVALRSGTRASAAVVGGLYGLLAMTSATFFYIAAASGGAVALACLRSRRSRQQDRERLIQVCIAMAVMIAAVTPWVVRNYVHTGEVSLTQRAGAVLLVRAYKNQMTWDEWIGGFYYYGPGAMKPLLGRTLGFSDADAEEGGRLQRLNRERTSSFYARDARADDLGRPNEAITYYRKWRAERTRLTNQCAARADVDTMSCAENAMKEEAVALLAASPASHLVMTPLFFWRGIWTMSGATWPLSRNALASIVACAVNAFAVAALLGCFFWGVLRGHGASLAIAFVPCAALALYALTTHFIPRYSAPLIPCMVVASVWTMTQAAAWCAQRVWPNLRLHQLHESEA